MKDYAKVYGRNQAEVTPGGVLRGIIKRAYEQTGRQVVVLIDEYDAPLLEVLHEEETLAAKRKVMQEFYQPLKANERMIKFCFITGITKFSQLSIFSTINNLMNVTMQPRFSAICGITEEEVKSAFKDDIAQMAENYECTPEEMFQKIKLRYDGYHFAGVSEDIYNPFSLLSAFAEGELKDYWFATGTPTFLIRQMQHFQHRHHFDGQAGSDRLNGFRPAYGEHEECAAAALPERLSDHQGLRPRIADIYAVDSESRGAYRLPKGLLPTYVGLESSNVQVGFALKFWRALKKDDIELAMQEMQTYMAGIPYVEGFKQKLEEAATKEGFYEYTMYLIFSMLNVYVKTQVKCAGGRTDMVVWMPDTTYVFEMKVNGTAQEALEQIDSKSYALPYQLEGKKVVKVGVRFDAETRTPQEWVVARPA